MSKERDLLVSCLDEFKYHDVPCSDLIRTIKWLLNEPEQTEQETKQDWYVCGYKQGFIDGQDMPRNKISHFTKLLLRGEK